MQVRATLLPVVVALALVGCADLNSISRRTSLPGKNDDHGVAIHLDAQQRLVIYRPDGTYCAEASPDAMAAYAAALALGVSAPSEGAGSGAQSGQSSIASIGLRTQSITLMRDALYRLCEATANGKVSRISATQLLARSQDLTAVVVAVEQLTGAVAANQAILSGTTNAEASASLISDAAQADIARQNKDKKLTELNQATEARKAQEAVVSGQQTKVDTAQKAVNEPPGAATPDELATLEAERKTLSTEQGKLDVARAKEESAQASFDDATQVANSIQSANSAALTHAAAGTTSSGQFSSVVPRIQLDKTATEQVAKEVNSMVTTVLNKDYTGADCMFLLTNVTELGQLSDAQRDLFDKTFEQCSILLNAKIQSEVAKIQAQQATLAGWEQVNTDSAAKIKAYLNKPGAYASNRDALLKASGLQDLMPADLKNAPTTEEFLKVLRKNVTLIPPLAAAAER